MDWRQERIDEITARIGWASLAGLFWLKEGESLVGTGETVDISFSKTGQDTIGKMNYVEGKVFFERHPSSEVKENDVMIDSIRLRSDREPDPSLLTYQHYYWTIIDRNSKMGLRVWDTTHIGRTQFTELDYYEINPSYRVEASFVPFENPKEIKLKNILGMDINQQVPGYLEFNLHGTKLKIEPIDGGNDNLFLIFADGTTGGDTYGGGRYLYCKKPGLNNKTIIDFNMSHTPPCGFTEFATCLLPSKTNTFEIEILAGEKYLFDH